MSVLDERTARTLFKENFRVADAFYGRKSLDDVIATPITDIGLINDRLDAIGELVGSEDLRGKIEIVMQALDHSYTGFYARLERFYDQAGRSRFGLHSLMDEAMRDVKRAISTAAEFRDMPSFSRQDVKTRILQELALQYEKVLLQHPDGLTDFLECMAKLRERINRLDFEENERIRAGKEKQGVSPMVGFLKFDKSEKGIDHKTLESLLGQEKLSRFLPAIRDASKLRRSLNVWHTFAEIAVKGDYSRPEVVLKEQNCLIIEDGWSTESHIKKAVSNPTLLDKDCRVEVIEGVNSGGKTVDIKKAFYIAATALAGCWVPARYAKVSIRDRIVVREKGTGDVMSAFRQDCRSCESGYPPAGEYWLIGMDETFTSTEKRGGAALTYGLIKAVLEQGRSLLVMSSHYPELSRAFDGDRRVQFSHFPFTREPSEDGERVVFPYKKVSGPMKDYSYAIAVARMQGFDRRTLELAEQRLRQK